MNQSSRLPESGVFVVLSCSSTLLRKGTISALCCPDGRRLSRSVVTIVQFKRLNDKEINEYVAQKDWEGKAGAYGIQGSAESFVKMIRGSYSNVVGLSLYDTMQMLKGSGYLSD